MPHLTSTASFYQTRASSSSPDFFRKQQIYSNIALELGLLTAGIRIFN